MKSFKKVAVTILAAVMMLLISTTVFAADSPVKTSFNASLTKKTVTYTGKKQQPTGASQVLSVCFYLKISRFFSDAAL